MEGISDIKIVGIDELRPPRIRKEPYINLYFKLSHKAPKDWCSDFNSLISKSRFTVNIKVDEGLFIETWVRKPEEIEIALSGLKEAIIKCNEAYIARIEAQEKAAAARRGESGGDEGEQGKLNRIVAALNFD